MAFFFFIVTYNYIGGAITAETVYYILGLFGNLELALNHVIPYGLSLGAESFAVIERIESILLAEEATLKTSENKNTKDVKIKLEEVTVKITDGIILNNVFLDICDSGLYIVEGHIGSGKSIFLKTLLQECDTTGTIDVTGSISYASQEPWIFPSTIKNNILFGENFNKNRYQQILEICNLDYDLKQFPDGEMTIVGSCDNNLSKGQQVRINLARAIYKQADIYLIDDSLASLDGYVSDCIFQNCIKTFLKDKICLLVTNNINYINQTENTIIIQNKSVFINKKREKEKIQVYASCEKVTNTKSLVEDKKATKKVYYEHKKVGSVSWKDYYKYISYAGGLIVLCLLIVIFSLSQFTSSYGEKLISQW